MKKMILIPYDQYIHRLKGIRQDETKIIQDKTLNENSTFDKEQNDNLIQELQETHTGSDAELDKRETTEGKLCSQLILLPFGKANRLNAEIILTYIDKNLDWNENGELVVDTEVITGSHITDLIKDCMYNYKNFQPLGYEIFYDRLNIPLSLIKNNKRHHLIGKGSQKNVITQKNPSSRSRPPPPGLPVNNEPIDITLDSDNNWISQWKTH